MNSNEKLLNIARMELENGRGREDILSKLQASGLNVEQSKKLLDIATLYKNKYFSRSARMKRTLMMLLAKFKKSEGKAVFQLLTDYLISADHYNSLYEIEEKIEQNANEMRQLEISTGYRDLLYEESGEFEQKVYILMNLHFSDFEDSLQQQILNLLNRDKIAHSIDSRAKFMRTLVANVIPDTTDKN